jgi:hypothetical protein
VQVGAKVLAGARAGTLAGDRLGTLAGARAAVSALLAAVSVQAGVRDLDGKLLAGGGVLAAVGVPVGDPAGARAGNLSSLRPKTQNGIPRRHSLVDAVP